MTRISNKNRIKERYNFHISAHAYFIDCQCWMASLSDVIIMSHCFIAHNSTIRRHPLFLMLHIDDITSSEFQVDFNDDSLQGWHFLHLSQYLSFNDNEYIAWPTQNSELRVVCPWRFKYFENGWWLTPCSHVIPDARRNVLIHTHLQ